MPTPKASLFVTRIATILVLAFSLSSCAALQTIISNSQRTRNAVVPPTAPTVRVANTTLSHHPSDRDLAMYFCTQYASRSPLGPMGAMVCRAFGQVPTREDLRFSFDVELEVSNPNRIELPLVQALVGFRAFPEINVQQNGRDVNLGAVCLSFCDDPTRCAQSADACTSNEPEIRDMNDFAMAATNFLISTALGERRFEDLRIRTIQPNQSLRVVARLSLDIEQMLALIERVAGNAIEEAQRGREPRIVIPYSLDGSVWVTVENFGRLAATFPTVTGEWDLLQALNDAAQAGSQAGQGQNAGSSF